MSIAAKPHSNGNTPEHFQEEGRALYKLANSTLDEIHRMGLESLNGRNYQHHPEPAEARSADIARLHKGMEGLILLRDLGLDIFNAGERT